MSYISKAAQANQREKLRSDQVANNAGGFVWSISPMDRLERFLILGSEANTYYQKSRDLTRENIACVEDVLASDPYAAIDLVVDVSQNGRATKQDPTFFVLAKALSHENVDVRRYALEKVNLVVRTGHHLFQFEHFLLESRGHGPIYRRAIRGWYESKSADNLAYQIVKYRNRQFGGSTRAHENLIKTSRPSPERHDEQDRGAWNSTIQWAIGKNAVDSWLPGTIEGFQKAQKCQTEEELFQVLKIYKNLSWEMVPTNLRTKKVWQMLILNNSVPTNALVRNLATLSRLEAIPFGSTELMRVVELLSDETSVSRSRIHPLQALVALATYSQGVGERGRQTWEPQREIVDALDGLFYKSFGNVKPSGKRICLALDISGSMDSHPVQGLSNMSARITAAAMALVTANAESMWKMVGFTDAGRTPGGWSPGWATYDAYQFGSYQMKNGISELQISPRQRLDDVVQYTRSLTLGRTDCALPMLWAAEKALQFDAFVIYTDNETWSGKVHPAEALRKYRATTGINAKLVVVGMTSTGFSIADPNDVGMLDVVGMDPAVPNVITEFVN